MARIETDPNYTSPTFSRATAATDLFKKEDVQNLAAAVSTHDHSSGKGLPLTAGAIPNGSITSAMIADGTIATADIAAGAVSQLMGQYASTPSFSTTATGVWVVTPVAVTATFTGAPVRVEIGITLQHSAASVVVQTVAGWDGGALSSAVSLSHMPSVATGFQFISWAYYFTPPAGAHTLSVMVWNNNAGTLSLAGGQTGWMFVTEQRR